jgi:hypothetical protein
MAHSFKSLFIQLPSNDNKAREHILASLSICAHDHILSAKLLEHFRKASGTFHAIIGDWYNLDQMPSYDRAVEPPPGSYLPGYYPQDLLVKFVSDYLQGNEKAVVVSENWGAKREHVARWVLSRPRVVYFGNDEVYHIVTPDVTDPDLIEASIIEAHHWQTNVCSSCRHLPEGDSVDESFLDEITHNAKHIFVPAFDLTGYLIWSPVARQDMR